MATKTGDKVLISQNPQGRLPHNIYCGSSTACHHILCDQPRSAGQMRQLRLADLVPILAGGAVFAASAYAMIWALWIIGIALRVGG